MSTTIPGLTRYQTSSACWVYTLRGVGKVGEWWSRSGLGVFRGERGRYRLCSDFEDYLARRLIAEGRDIR